MTFFFTVHRYKLSVCYIVILNNFKHFIIDIALEKVTTN